jgi:hypothetical protein
MSSDWRPQKIDTEAVARDAQLDRIEQKLDQLLAAQSSFSASASYPATAAKDQAPKSGVLGVPHQWNSSI